MPTELSSPSSIAAVSSLDPSPHRRKPSLNALTGLRFFAAMGVVLYHFAGPILKSRSTILSNTAVDGFVAVDLFYLLSGFILAYSYLGSGGSLVGTKSNFYVARLARVYPAYLLAFLLAAPADIVTSLHVNRLPVAIAKLTISAISVLTLQQAWTPWTAWNWNYPAWSVSVEAFFYLVFPFIAVRLARLRPASALRAAGLLWIVALIPPFILWIATGVTAAPQTGDHLQMAVEFTPIMRLPEFMIGILLGRAFTLGQLDRLNGAWVGTLAAVALAAVFAFCPWIPHPLLANGLLAPLFALLIAGLAQGRGALAWFLSLPFMVVLGEASYGIYILQIPVALVIHRPPPYYSMRLLCFYCVLLVVCSVLSWYFVETPLRKAIRRWFSSPAH
jgi:peptidoglycan/LPS O-acetylase OafA/YrhL